MVPLPGAEALPLVATSVQRLSNHRWLICNGYAGTSLSGDKNFGGEVFEYDPMGGADQEVKWCSPRLEWIPVPAGAPPCAVPTEWKQTTTNTHNLRQPKSAVRQ
jgi:hypothetical protein